jgi:hypothetical protein
MLACSTTKPQGKRDENVEPRAQPFAPASASSSLSAPSRAEVALEDLVSADANGLTRMSPEMFFILQEVDKLADSSERCWSQLKSKLLAGYQVMLPSDASPSQRDAYFIAEGALPREEVESCARRAFERAALEIHPAGELVAFSSWAPTVYAAWRGRFLLLGSQRQLLDALHTPTSNTAARWRALIGQALPAPFWVVSIDQRPTNASIAMGDPTDFMLTFDKIEGTPHPLIAGRFAAHYPSAALAAKGAAWIKSWSTRGEFPFSVPPPAAMAAIYHRMAKAIGKLNLVQDANRVQIEWDSDQFGGLESWNAFFQHAGEQFQRAP